MSDAALTVDSTASPKSPKNVTSPNATFEIPRFEMPKFEMPAAMRDLAEKGGAQAKENYEMMKATTDEMTGMVEATYATTAKRGHGLWPQDHRDDASQCQCRFRLYRQARGR